MNPMSEQAQPNPLPPTIPPGVCVQSEHPAVCLETSGTLELGSDGIYRGPVQVSSPASPAPPYEQPKRSVRPERIDWQSYRIATGDF